MHTTMTTLATSHLPGDVGGRAFVDVLEKDLVRRIELNIDENEIADETMKRIIRLGGTRQTSLNSDSAQGPS